MPGLINRLRSLRSIADPDAEMRLVAKAGLFDAAWYLRQYPDVAAAGVDPLRHFLNIGWREHRNPNPLFDTRYYLATYDDVKRAGVNPLVHYLRRGAREGRNPHPLFHTAYFVANTPQSAQGGRNPLAFFLVSGSGAPNPAFDTDRYKGQFPEVAKSKINPLDHFLTTGAERNGSPHTLFDPAFAQRASGETPDAAYAKQFQPSASQAPVSAHPLFDAEWYLNRYPDVAASGLSPLVHYLLVGAHSDRDPHPLFDAAWYRRAYPSRPRSKPALIDYLEADTHSVRQPNPLFDRRWYIDTYKGETPPGVDALTHYVTVGAARGFHPHPMFSPAWYCENNPDAARHAGGALAHFLHVGRFAGRDPHPLFDTRYYVRNTPAAAQDESGPVAHYLLQPIDSAASPHPLFDPRWYVACNPEVKERNIAPLAHLLGYGLWENRDPHPLFETAWYVSQNPQSVGSLRHPLEHYLSVGVRNGVRPSRFFDPDFYARRLDAEDGGAWRRRFDDPLSHFALRGMAEGRSPNADYGRKWRGAPDPDIYGAGEENLAALLRDTGLTSRWILACEAQKHDRAAYDERLEFLIANQKRWRIPQFEERPRVTVIIPVYNGLHFTLGALESIARFPARTPFEVIVADNVSDDRTQEVLSRRSDIRYVRNPNNLGFLRSCNRAATFARGEFIFLLNNDTLVAPGWLDELIAAFGNFGDAGLVGSKLIYPDGVLQEAGGIIWNDGSAWNFGKFRDEGDPQFNYVRETDYCSGAAIMVPKRLWDELGGFDETFVPSYCEDSDLALRIRDLGYSVLYCPQSVVMHFEGMTQGRDVASGVKAYQVENTKKLYKRWQNYLRTLQAPGKNLNEAKDRGVKQRALFLDNCTPTPKEDAGSVTALNFMLLLRDAGFQVTFIPQDNYLWLGEATRELQRRAIETLYGPYCVSVEDHLREEGERYDVIVMMRPDSYERHIAAIRKYAPRAKLVYHTCDLHYLRYQREAELTGDQEALANAAKVKKVEFEALETADASILHSTAEAELLRKELGAVKTHVFGWAIPVSGAVAPFEARKDVIFVGGFNHGPNVDAVVFAVDSIMPAVWRENPDIRLHVVGARAPEKIRALAGARVIVHGFVEDLSPLFESCRLAIAPLRYGAGIKGKVATAMSVGLPNILTSVAAEGMALESGVNCIIADDAEDFAKAIIEVYGDGATWARLSGASAKFADETYGPTAAGRVFDKIISAIGFEPPMRGRPPELVDPTGRRGAVAWPAPFRPVVRLERAADWKALKRSPLWDRMRRRDAAAREKLAGARLSGYPAFSLPANAVVEMRPGRCDGLKESLVCPASGLNNAERLLLGAVATIAGARNGNMKLSIESTRLKAWLEINGGRNGLPAPEGRYDAFVSDRSRDDHGADLKVVGESLGDTAVAIFSRDSFDAASEMRDQLRAAEFGQVAIELYHSPEYGHLGENLFLVRASR